MPTDRAAAFWSYVHDDDDAEGGRITELARDIGRQFGLLTGGELEIFLDRDTLRWGDDWRERIAEALAATTFFIPVMTPRYFDSVECRREVIRFAREAARLGVESLVLPVLYTPVPDLEAEEPTDEALRLVKPYQYENWTELRFEERGSGAYRRAVASLAQRLAEIVVALSSPALTDVRATEPNEEEDDEPGFLELIAEGEEAMPRWQRTVEQMRPVMEAIGKISEKGAEATRASDARGGGAAGRLRAAASVASQLREPTNEALRLGDAYSREVGRVDGSITALLNILEEQPPTDPDELDQAREFLESIGEMVATAAGTTKSLEEFSATLTSTSRAARVLRPVSRDLQKALRNFVDAQVIYDEWDRRIQKIQEDLPPADGGDDS